MKLREWFDLRGAEVVARRGRAVLTRYGLTSAKAMTRIARSAEALAAADCTPTFLTPGTVIEREPAFFRRLQETGAEIAVHSYHHVDLSVLPLPEATRQLERALEIFGRFGLEGRGFRCPYLSWTEEVRDALPPGMFDYSSNEAIDCQPGGLETEAEGRLFKTLKRFYKGKPFSQAVSVPSARANLIEIPVCVPDDLQIHDGLQLGPEGLERAWGEMLDQMYERGELFNLLFHMELADACMEPLLSLLRRARRFPLPVWVARLRDVSDWWREKATFTIETTQTDDGVCLTFVCSPRATILARGLETSGRGQAWDDRYTRLQVNTLELPTGPLPFVGLPASAPKPVVALLREQGYIVDTSDSANRCATYLDGASLDGSSPVEIIDRIEASSGPLVRYGRWPNGARNALSVTGDLDALSLLDYAGRPFER